MVKLSTTRYVLVFDPPVLVVVLPEILFFFFYRQIVLDVAISVAMVLVVLRQKELSAALTQRPERSNSVRYIIKVSLVLSCLVASCCFWCLRGG